MDAMQIQLDQTIRNTESLMEHFNRTGYALPKKSKMTLSEQQLDEIEEAMGGTDDYIDVQHLLQNIRNIESVAKAFVNRALAIKVDLYWKSVDIENEHAQLKREKEDV